MAGAMAGAFAMARYSQARMAQIEATEETVVVPKGKQIGRVVRAEQLLVMAFGELKELKTLIEEERRARLVAAKYPYSRR
jgi:hypothetical protein